MYPSAPPPPPPYKQKVLVLPLTELTEFAPELWETISKDQPNGFGQEVNLGLSKAFKRFFPSRYKFPINQSLYSKNFEDWLDYLKFVRQMIGPNSLAVSIRLDKISSWIKPLVGRTKKTLPKTLSHERNNCVHISTSTKKISQSPDLNLRVNGPESLVRGQMNLPSA